MSLVANYNVALHKELGIYAAWLPVVNTIKLGDFGVMDGGVFRTLGNVENFGVKFTRSAGQDAKIDFMSEGVAVSHFEAGMPKTKLPADGTAEAKIVYKFTRENSCLIRAALSVVEMDDINTVGKSLAANEEWEGRFRVVSSVYTGNKCLVITTQKRDTEVEFSGTASVLAQLESGSIGVTAGLSIGGASERVFKCVGKTGVVGLRMFKLGSWFRKGVRFLKGQESFGTELADEAVVETSEKWGAQMADDPLE